uniref:RNA-directed DNA polymerase, eukaryota n=1 Tax=Tanacetum cinerariifolium TaxID=118510 RepID=A0A6L2P1S1_TANCI|nr:RNA-directed DNA polymerase, eukaryota [Tanacetum cinerariifolium]
MNVVKSLQELKKLQSLEAAQKAKIKWATEGDEDSKYYHGIRNKERNQHNIRGMLAEGGKDRPPMLSPGNYVKWKSRIKRYIDTKPNNEDTHYCLQNPPYKFKWTEKSVPVAEGSSESLQNAIERLKQGESINVQDLETSLYWEFKKFTSRDGESLKSYYSRFYKMMNELSQELKTMSYHKLYDILKPHQNEVNEIKAERLARTANPLALVAQQQPLYHPQNYPNHYTQNPLIRSQPAATKNRGKAIVNSSPPTYDQEPTMVTEDDEMSKEKEINKLVALISLSFKKIYKPTNNNLKTSSNTYRENQDNTPTINRGTVYNNQMVVNVTRARENVGTHVVQQSGIQCYNYKEYGHVARECQKPKQAKDAAYHKEKMLFCKQEEARLQLNAKQADWRDETDKPKDQESKAHYLCMAQIQEVTPDAVDNSGPIFDVEPLQNVQNDNDKYNVFANDREHYKQPESVSDTYLEEQCDTNITIDSLDMSTNGETVDQDDNDLTREHELLASLIEKLKCKIDDNKNRKKI